MDAHPDFSVTWRESLLSSLVFCSEKWWGFFASRWAGLDLGYPPPHSPGFPRLPAEGQRTAFPPEDPNLLSAAPPGPGPLWEGCCSPRGGTARLWQGASSARIGCNPGQQRTIGYPAAEAGPNPAAEPQGGKLVRVAARTRKLNCRGGDGRAEPGTPRGLLGGQAVSDERMVLTPSPEAGRRTAISKSGRCGFLWRLRDKQWRLGLFEIGPGHELHQLTCMMQVGLWAAIQVSMDHPPTGTPTEEDFCEVQTQVHENFELGTLAGPAFAWLRRSLGLIEEDYQAALGPGGPYLQFLSTSKSKASFFLSCDQRFFLKTQQRREVRVLLAHLPRYVQHLQRYPHSLLARLLGVHSLRVTRGKKKYFIIMQSVFYPPSRISERYDIKGCEMSRWVEPAPEGSPLVLVLKDLNFQGKTINLGPQRTWFLRQMELDTTFLRELNVLDYSLLMAFQRLHEDEIFPNSSFVFCTARRERKKSVCIQFLMSTPRKILEWVMIGQNPGTL
ncbi:phosphatidylinositol 4-phosphate 5-kinase-like protein 1 isoform X2 [Erinaceus europaeus]|uniref:Phosphatidylinositol 4-phosphate 5-kinase-like protein 1 isoform X2 n=1 Tax=Erinaceus europaeus TaxID=9365 RepID=A0ABM3Y563_ERIEU|nr:phosphatidylinositol 4-phosphate 5-kinase-like protein 1 isoform X2 [Erinaceus europaeus]